MSHELHPDDVLPFAEIRAAMFKVSREYGLGLKTVSSLPEQYLTRSTDRVGDCNASGDVRLFMREKIDGAWGLPLSSQERYRTAAHELAHLLHMSHNEKHRELTAELEMAMQNTKEDHRDRAIRRVVQMQANRDSESQLGNEDAADAFAHMISKMLVQYELAPSDIEYARSSESDPVIEVRVLQDTYGLGKKGTRIAWQDALACITARAHLCRYLVQIGSNSVWFVGTKSHATMAEYAYGTLVAATDRLSWRARGKYYRECQRAGDTTKAQGFRQAWLHAFVDRIAERMEEGRLAAISEAPAGTALIRLDKAIEKAQEYIDRKFTTTHGIVRPNTRYLANAEGLARGRSAADAVVLGRTGIQGDTRKALTS